MGLYNILKFSRLCPNCGNISEMNFQMHFACSPISPDILKTFNVGEMINWPMNGDPDYSDPTLGRETIQKIGSGVYIEHSYGECKNCLATLTAKIKYRNFIIEEICDIEIEEN